MNTDALPRPPFILRVLWAPRPTFAAVVAARRGYGLLFAILAVEFVLIEPIDVTTHLLRVSFAPVAALIGVWSAYLHYALPSGVAVFAVGLLLYYALRWRARPRLDVWTAGSLAAYAFTPHLFLVAVGVILAALGLAHPVLPHYPFDPDLLGVPGLILKAVITYGPSAALFALGARIAWHGGVEPQPAPSRLAPARVVMAAAAFLLAAALAVSVGRVITHWEEARPPMPGDTLPAFSLPQLDGPPLDSGSLAGSVALIDFWATWCPPCVASMPHLETLHQEYAPRGFKLVSVNTEPDSAERVRNFVREHQLTFPIYVDRGNLQRSLRVQTLPTALLVDAQGEVREIYVGAPSPSELRRKIERLLPQGAAAP